MKKVFLTKNIFFFFILFVVFVSETKETYKEIPLKLEKNCSDSDLPLYIETDDTCSKWVPALFSQILIIKYGISHEYKDENYELIFKSNPASLKKMQTESLTMHLFSGPVSIFHPIFIASSGDEWPSFCQFGLGYSDIFSTSSANKMNYNVMKNLINSNQVDKNVFSFDKWNFSNSEIITSKIFIGDSHEDFLLDNVGTCKIQNDSGYYGCIFDDFIFLNETFPLIKGENNKSIIIYFSSEFTNIYFPQDFQDKIADGEKCEYSTIPSARLTCEELKGKEYLPLKLRSENMNITLEVDYLGRYYQYSTEGVANILFHADDYIIFPLTMLKNFHVQFNLENNTINFYTNDTSLLEVPKKEEPTPGPQPDPSQEPEEEPSDGPSAGLVVFLVILGILLVGGLGYVGFLFWKKKQNPDIEKRFNKYAKFEDEDINENKVVY